MKENITETKPKVLIMGIGNILLMDEGAGVRVVEDFQKRYFLPEDVEILDGGTSGIELLEYIENRENLFIIDVVKSGAKPGSIIRMEGDEVPKYFAGKISPHQIGVSDLLAAAALTLRMPKQIVLLGIEPSELKTGLEMTDIVKSSVPKISDMLADELEKIGIKINKSEQ
ncbi:MAG: HyaD/HybD family hydrogenase maturation endopeptidase [Nitrospiraceae bacterium]|nr:HyaD/HybD family hydrogenase maturation endopeptidase [Nitrospiraceae bacterium]